MSSPASYLRVAIGDCEVGVPIESVSRTVRCEHVQYSPTSHGPFGWILTPEEVEIWQIHSAFGRKPPRSEETPCIELVGSPRRAFIADEIRGSVHAERQVEVDVPLLGWPCHSPLVGSIALVDGQPLPILDPAAITTTNLPPSGWRPGHSAAEGSGTTVTPPAPSAIGKALQVTISPGRGDGPITLVLSLSQIEAITADLRSVALPYSPPFLRGVVGWRDRVALWIDWPTLLGIPQLSQSSGSRRIVVAATPSGDLIVFEGETEMTILSRDALLDLSDPLPIPTQEVVLIQGRIDSKRAILPDLEAVLTFQPTDAKPPQAAGVLETQQGPV